MADTITYKLAGRRFGCGDEYENLTVVNFFGPGGARACAYSCNMNIDLDGEPQAYGPFNNASFKPLDYLENAGWKTQAGNDAVKSKYATAKKALDGLEQQKKSLPPTASEASKKALDAKIDAARKTVKVFNPYPATAKNFEKIFWHWYGLKAFSSAEANRQSFLETVGKDKKIRRPVLDTTGYLEDVYGRFPVVASEYEPGPGYYVSVLPRPINGFFPEWDQRCFLPLNLKAQQAYAALSVPLQKETGLKLKDIVLAIRTDTYAWTVFPFLDTGFQPKVGECSRAAFGDLQGKTGFPRKGRPTYSNDFQVLYLAFANSAGQTPAAMLANFAKATNWSDFEVILAFVAQVTTDAKAKSRGGTVRVSGDPLREWETWRKGKVGVPPRGFEMIAQSLSDAGFNPIPRK